MPGQSEASPQQGAAPQHIRSEATRLLCAGVYFDVQFRRRVIEQLVEHEERPIAPSLGIDALPVLAHALYARRREAETGLVLLAVWAAFIWLGLAGVGSQMVLPVPIPWFLAYGLVCLVSRSVRGGPGAVFTLGRAVLKEATRGRLKAVLPVLPFAVSFAYWAAVLFTLFSGADAWAAVVFPALLVPPLWAYRAHVVSVMRHKLSRGAYARTPREKLPDSEQYRRIGAAIDREQHASLAIYDPFRPFVGAGEPYQPWSFVMELKRRAGQEQPKRLDPTRRPGPGADAGAGAAPLTGREVIDLITPRLEALRTSAAASSRDRLRGLEIDEMVYLPVGAARDQVTYEPDAVRQHLDGAVGEGGEARRHFLRVRVGAWDEQVAVSLLVRVHTQGGMLVLEVVPHVLTPVRPEFKSVDVITAPTDDGLLREAVRGLITSPAAGCAAGISLIHTAVSVFRTWLTLPQYAIPDGPATSVRELGSVPEISLLQEMDISRYVKTLQDRIASGVREALRTKGYETGEFEQYVINVNGGGVFIGKMSGGAVASGERASAKQVDAAAEAGGGRS
ncbi:hypothetical protein ACIRPT_22650 [Streptomyces sp. NPDC101227]|uniref:hypothetical protein n=1 Tax=Streptomyces sp. NPDC101227 TaxID=3366136 RepID=UPI003827D5E1